MSTTTARYGLGLGRVFVGVVLVALNVNCNDDKSEPCGGCGSPHPYTSYSGGTTEKIDGKVTLVYSQGTFVESCAPGFCTWTGGLISIHRALPKEWTGWDAAGHADDAGDARDAGDAGDAGDVDAGDVGDAGDVADDAGDAGDDADAPDADTFIGLPRGWGKLGRVAAIDLGATDLTTSTSRLVGARIIYCSDPYETLVSSNGDGDAGSETSSSSFMCQSGILRPANVEPLYGTFSLRTSRRDGTTTSSVRTLDAKNDNGFIAELTHATETAPLVASTSSNCY
jgi:hypothetical protein